MIDDLNQRAARGNNDSFPDDRVTGYTIQQIENALYGNGGVSLFSNWKHNLINMFDNPTEEFVDALFRSWD